ncbi:MAG: hypothetical protein NTV98_03325 [Candidatus Roizmanbacteria bacterium]|nr:hypothetical protein [Candidatus Roizmanbacteria bacterium]
MKKILPIFLTVVTLLLIINTVRAQEISITPKPTGKFGEAARELKDQNQTERKNLIEENQVAREKLRLENKDARTKLQDENKTERENLKNGAKDLLEGKTPEEKLTLMPTIKAGKQALADQNKAERQGLWKAQWDSKKALRENIQTNMNAFRETVRSRWTSLWNSVFGKK